MQFHFGLGVGHVFSHYCSPQAQVATTCGSSHAEESEHRDENESDSDSDKDNDCAPMINCTEQLGSSVKSLIGEFEGMYNSELDLDYEN